MATKMYEAKKYNKAIRIFEQIAPVYRGKPESEDMYFMFSQSYWLMIRLLLLKANEQYYLLFLAIETLV